MDYSLLLPEILSLIFKSLNLRDRKSVRLTCHLWFKVCSQPSIIQREKFVILRHENLREVEISKTMLNCTNFRSNVELYGLCLPLLSPNVWMSRGHLLKSLLLRGCKLSDDILSKIIFHCSNLTNLYIHKSDYIRIGENSLDKLIALQFKQMNLTSFQCYSSTIPDEVSDKVYQICSNIRTLGADNPGSSLKRLSRVKTFIDNKVRGPRNPECYWISSLESRLKKLCMSLNLDLPGNYRICRDFFSNQTELEKVELIIYSTDCPSEIMKHLLFLVLETLPKLEQIVWMVLPTGLMNFNHREFARLLHGTMNLEFLNLSVIISGTCLLLPSMSINNSGKLKKLKSLKLAFLNVADDGIYLRFLNECHDLQCLELEHVTDKILNTVFKNHIGLKNLGLGFHFRKCTFAGFTGFSCCTTNSETVYSFHRLQQLEHLKVLDLTPHLGGLDGFLSEFDFPNLKCFSFTLRNHHGKQARHCLLKVLKNVSLKAPQLEILQIGSTQEKTVLKANELIDHHITKLSKLRLLQFTSTYRARDQLEELRPLFNVCPSLNNIANVQFGLRLSYDHILRESRMLFNTRFIIPECCMASSFHLVG